MILKHEFKVYKDSEGQFYSEQNKDNSLKEIVLDVRKPNYNDQKEAQFHYSKTFSDAIKNNVPSRVKMEQILKETGEWSDEDIKREKEMLEAIRNCQRILINGKIKKSEAAKLAWENIQRNNDYLEYCAKKNSYFDKCAESLAEQAKFNYLTYLCTVYNTNGKHYWDNYDKFIDDNLKNPLVVNVAGALLANLIYSIDMDYRRDWPEYQFLIKYKFVNNNFEKLDKEGNVIKEEEVEDIKTIETAEYLDD